MDPKLRDILLFTGGFAGMVHQTVIAQHTSTILVTAFLGMMIGAPAVYRVLDWLTGRGRDDKK